MATNATGLFMKLKMKAEAAWGTIPGTGSAQLLRRTSSSLELKKQTYRSNEIQPDRMVRDFRHGVRSVSGVLADELSPGTWSLVMGAIMGLGNSAPFVAGVNTGALTNVTAAAGPPGTFTRAAGSFLTDGFKVGDIVRWTGWATGGSAANNARNYRITALTALIMTVTGTGAEAVVSQASGDSVTCTVTGKKAVPSTSPVESSFSFEHWYSDVNLSETYYGCKATQMQISLPSTGLATISTTIMGKDIQTQGSEFFVAPTAVTTASLTAAVNGTVRVNGSDVAYITAMTLTINGNYTPEPVIGSNEQQVIAPGVLDVTGSITALFQDGTLRDIFLNETAVSINVVLYLGNAINADFISFVLNNVKFGGDTKADAMTAVKQTIPFQALNNTAGGTGVSTDFGVLTIQDSLA